MIFANSAFSSLTLMYHKYLGFREFAKYEEWGKFVASFGHPKAKRFSAPGGDAIAPLNRALTLRMSREPIQQNQLRPQWGQFRYNVQWTPCCYPIAKHMALRNQEIWTAVHGPMCPQGFPIWHHGSGRSCYKLGIPARYFIHAVLFANTGTAWTLHMIFNKINKYSIS